MYQHKHSNILDVYHVINMVYLVELSPTFTNKIKCNMSICIVKYGHYIHGKCALGSGSNKWEQLSALFHLFHTTSNLVLRELQVFSNSIFVINWMHGISQSMNINLTQPKTQLKEITGIVHWIYFEHIYREINNSVD